MYEDYELIHWHAAQVPDVLTEEAASVRFQQISNQGAFRLLSDGGRHCDVEPK